MIDAKNFEWTDELVSKFVHWYKVGKYQDPIEQFKQEQLSKRDWEIEMFVGKYNTIEEIDFGKNSNGRFEANLPFSYEFSEDEMIANGAKIHSVRRLSDGEVFCVGDYYEIYWPKKDVVKIDNFNINEGGGLFLNYTKDGRMGINISIARKVPQQKKVLFLTEDGYGLSNKNDKVYSVCPKGTFEVTELSVGYLTRTTWGEGSTGRPYKNWKHFYSKENRDLFIRDNMPMFSVEDIMTIVRGIMDGSLGRDNKSYLNATFKQLAKSKMDKK